MIYFAGHGVEMAGTAYLLPTDAEAAKEHLSGSMVRVPGELCERDDLVVRGASVPSAATTPSASRAKRRRPSDELRDSYEPAHQTVAWCIVRVSAT